MTNTSENFKKRLLRALWATTDYFCIILQGFFMFDNTFVLLVLRLLIMEFALSISIIKIVHKEQAILCSIANIVTNFMVQLLILFQIAWL